ncbi:MAG: RnfABCDGE type electron transport complex subunit G [Bacteroidales bacterium]|nr:RnfABCDGE type electron transport complex subunit G [Bacteroidales bacterium]
MAKKPSTLINMVVALLVITAISGGLLGLVYGMTKDTIAEVDQKKNAAAIAEVLGTDENSRLETVTIDDLTYNLAYDAQGNLLGAAVKTFSNAGFSGRIELMVGLLADGTINKVSVLQQSETPGLGANMVNPKFKDQFDGKNPASFKLSVTKDGGDVDAITAATISSRAFSEAVQLACDGFEANKNQFMKGGQQ